MIPDPHPGERDAVGENDHRPAIPDYELLRMIGRGSYGDVWLARSLTGTLRAVKIVWRERFGSTAPFEREFRGLKEFSAISLVEANQLALLHVGQNENAGFFYYVMELADDAEAGRTIDPARYVPLTAKELKARRGRLPAAECLGVSIELARALAALHRRGLLHRDIKPSNIIWVNGAPKLADIGLVASHTDAGTFVGTEGFVPPEGPGAPAGDVFALGKVLYELATGLDRAQFPQLPEKFGEGRERRVWFELNEIILRACEASVAQRYVDGAALLADLLALQAGRSPRGRRVKSRAWRAAAFLALGSVVAGGGFWWRDHRARAERAITPSTAKEPAVAVLAFENQSDDRQNDYFSEGVSEDLLDALAKIPRLKVTARTSAFYFKEHHATVPEIGQKLGVAYLVQGRVRKAGDRVRISAQLIRAADGFQLWSQDFERELKDLFALQDDIAASIVRELGPVLLGGSGGPDVAAQLQTAVRNRTQDVAAYQLLLEGRFLLHLRTPKSLARAAELLREAVQRDPQFAPAWADLAQTYGWQFGYGLRPYDETVAPALAAARRAVELAPDLADGHAALANVSVSAWNWDDAERESTRALQLAPRDTDVLQTAAWVALARGDFDGCIDYARRATAIDPFNLGALSNILMAEVGARRFAEAEAICRRIRVVAPDAPFPDWARRVTALAQGRAAELLDEATKSQNPWVRAASSAIALQLLGRRAGSDAALKEFAAMTHISSFDLAQIEAARGERDAAFANLEKALAGKPAQMATIKCDPFCWNLHDDPRWPEILRRMGFRDDPIGIRAQ